MAEGSKDEGKKVSTLKELEEKVLSATGVPLLHLDKGDRVRAGLSTGSLCLNEQLSGDPTVGFAWGRIVELFGPEQSGKTTLAMHVIAESQKLPDKPSLFIDAEHSVDPVYMGRIGVDLGRMSYIQPDSGEIALSVAESAVDSGYKVIVVDSVAALVPQAEIDGEMGDSHMGLQARLMSQAMRKLAGKTAKAGAIIIFINQIRMKIGVMFGNPEVTTGGNALKFYSSYRLDIRSPRGGAIMEKGKKKSLADGEDGGAEIGIDTNVKIIKNKCYPPFRRATFSIRYGEGIDKVLDLIRFMEHSKLFSVEVTKRKKANGEFVTREYAQVEGEVIYRDKLNAALYADRELFDTVYAMSIKRVAEMGGEG
jgi:recombination protein RecA